MLRLFLKCVQTNVKDDYIIITMQPVKLIQKMNSIHKRTINGNEVKWECYDTSATKTLM